MPVQTVRRLPHPDRRLGCRTAPIPSPSLRLACFSGWDCWHCPGSAQRENEGDAAMLNGIQKALILAPHTDDGELGCGGTMCKLIEGGCRVYYVAFSICEDSVPDGFEPEALMKEMYAATQVLGLQEKDVFVLRHKVRRFTDVRQDILEYMVKLRYEINPDWVFMPSSR